MYQPQGFIDSSNIIIINDKAHYYYTGNTYLEKFKNGLSLEDKFASDLKIEYNQIMNNEFTNKDKNKDNKKQKLNKINYDDENCSYKFPKERKGKFNKGKKGPLNKEEDENQLKDNENQLLKEEPINEKKLSCNKKEKYGKKKKNKIRQNGLDDKLFSVNQNTINPSRLLTEDELEDIYYEENYDLPNKLNNYYCDFVDDSLFNRYIYNEFDDYDKREASRYRMCGY